MGMEHIGALAMSCGGRSGCSRRLGRSALGIFGALLCALGLLGDRARAEDPWPFWGRTATRLGNTTTIGPQTPTIAWSIKFNVDSSDAIREGSPVMDAKGRVFVTHAAGITAIDSPARTVLWQFTDGGPVQGAAAVWGGRVVWGDALGFDTLYCFDAATGAEIWREEDRYIITSPVVSPDGVVFVAADGGAVLARRVEDGSEVWTTHIDPSAYCSPSLAWPTLLTSGSDGSDVMALDPLTGDTGWTFPTGREVFGLTPILLTIEKTM